MKPVTTTPLPRQRDGAPTAAPAFPVAPPTPEPPADPTRSRTRTVSVIVTCHGDVADWLRVQLRAIAGQELDQPWEVLIGDNGMAPATLEVVEQFRPALPGLRIVSVRDRPGQSYAVNATVAQAAGEDLILLNDDDVIAPGYVREMAAALAQHELVGGRIDSHTLNPWWLRRRRRPMQAEGLEQVLGDPRPVVVGAAMGVRRSAFQLVGGFDENLATQLDIDLSWRLHAAGIRPCFVGGAVIRYRYRRDLAALWRQERAYGFGEAKLYAKHRRAGLRRRTVRRTLRGWADVVLAVPYLHTRAGRAQLVTTAGAAVGRLAGSIAHRTLYL